MKLCKGCKKIREVTKDTLCAVCTKKCSHTPTCSEMRWVSGCIHKPPITSFVVNPAIDKGEKYKHSMKDANGVIIRVDIYDVLKAFDIRCPAIQHAIKKLLCAGKRGHKDTITDLNEAINSIHRAKELVDA